MSTTMTVRLNESIKERLDKLAKTSQRTKSFLAADAIEKYIELNEWQMLEIESAIEEAENDDFATQQELNDFNKKWQLNGN